ncbi:MAG: hypothetical protein IJZ82_12830 [Lachnospiraceae bacterium]|nr:hypothetical protein [Lachnospiraceae bacterium]
MEKKLYEKKQQQILDAFFKEFFTWSADNVGYWIVAGIFIFIHGIFLAFPYQMMGIEDSDITLVQVFAYMGYFMYITPYLHFTEKGRVIKLKEKLKYLPISQKQLRLYRLRKLLIFSLKLFAVFLLLQLFFSLVAYHEITLGNILYPLLCGFVFPFALNSIVIIFENTDILEFVSCFN